MKLSSQKNVKYFVRFFQTLNIEILILFSVTLHDFHETITALYIIPACAYVPEKNVKTNTVGP